VELISMCHRMVLNTQGQRHLIFCSCNGAFLRTGRSGVRVPLGARYSAPVQTGPGDNPASCTMGTGSFPGVNCGRSVLLTTHHLLAPRSWKSRAIPLLPSVCYCLEIIMKLFVFCLLLSGDNHKIFGVLSTTVWI
jgi:hypothetical protein